VAWQDILQDVVRYGDPLATFRASARKLDKYVEMHGDENYDDGYGDVHRDEMRMGCKGRLLEGLFVFRQTLFAKLPSFFTLQT
jgi:hypothetical protein